MTEKLLTGTLSLNTTNQPTNGTESRTNEQTNIRTDEQKDENYIPLSIIAGGITTYESAHEIMVLITYATSEISPQPFAVRSHEVWK